MIEDSEEDAERANDKLVLVRAAREKRAEDKRTSVDFSGKVTCKDDKTMA